MSPTLTPTAAVAANVTAFKPMDEACAVWVPGVGPNVQLLEARPCALVVVHEGDSVPPSGVDQVTVTPATPLLYWSSAAATRG